MKKELKKPVKETSQLRVKAYDGEACVSGHNNTAIVIGSGCGCSKNTVCGIFC